VFAEYNTTNANGTPLDLSKRINRYYRFDEKGDTIWCTAKQILSAQEAARYTIEAVMEGDDHWNPQQLFEPAKHPIGYVTINGRKVAVNQYGCFSRENRKEK
jgi:pectinesterase